MNFAFIVSTICLGLTTPNGYFNNAEYNKNQLNDVLNYEDVVIDEKLIVDDFSEFYHFEAPKGLEEPVYVNTPEVAFHPTTHFNTKAYFENFKTYSPINNIGSCGYVSLIQLMSYYDTFYNDYVYPEHFEYKNTTANTYQEAEFDSPGVIGEHWASTDYESYFLYCLNSFGYNLQSHLTVLNNIYLRTNNSDDFRFSIGAWAYQNVLNLFYGDDTTVKVENHSNKSQTEFIDIIKNSIDEGHPVIVHINNTPGHFGGGHSVVAYDYDLGGIYAHYGWGSGSTKYQLLNNIYNNIYWVAKLDYSNLSHSHSDNYIINGNEYCGCNLNDEVKIQSGGDSVLYPPTFYWMRDIYQTHTYKLWITTQNGTLYLIPSNNSVMLSQAQWSSICALQGNQYIVTLQRTVNGESYATKDSLFSLPVVTPLVNILQNEYGYEQQYFFYPKTKTHNINGISFTTKRLRTGFIEQEYVNLSPNRQGAGTAYLEYIFNYPIFKFDIEMSFWSAYENLDTSTGYAEIQYWDGLNWQTVVDILNDYDLSTNRYQQDTYTVTFPSATMRFRIISGVFNPSGTRNTGRISIGNVSIYSRGGEL